MRVKFHAPAWLPLATCPSPQPLSQRARGCRGELKDLERNPRTVDMLDARLLDYPPEFPVGIPMYVLEDR